MTMKNELAAARTFLQKRFPAGGRVLCAVSGGVDSMCLLDFMRRQKGFSIAAAHFHHQLREETADRDQRFVADWCRERGIPCFTGTGDTRALAAERGLSIEEAARVLRYGFLEKTAADGGFDAVFTAHHADDNAETMLLNLIRGTGAAGLTGIPPVRGIVCRPFLRVSRGTLEAYAEAYRIPYVEDETNRTDDAARNLLRHRVIPVLREINPRAVENMSFTASVLIRENEGMERLAAGLSEQAAPAGDGVSVSCRLLLDVPPALAERAVMRLLAAAAGRRKDFAAAHVEAVLDLAARGAGEVKLPYGLTAWKTGDTLFVSRRETLERTALHLNQPVRWGGFCLTLLDHREGEGLALRERIAQEGVHVTVAPAAPGERLALPGARGSRSVKRLCLDRHISLSERGRLPAIYADGRLAAVWRLGVDRSYLPEGKACRFIKINKETEESGI